MFISQQTGQVSFLIITITTFLALFGLIVFIISKNIARKGTNMDCKEFQEKMKQHCEQQENGCPQCCMRLYCYSPPVERTEYMLNEVIAYLDLEKSNNCNEIQTHSFHHNSREMVCPCTLDMSSALGYEHRQ